MAQSSRHPSYSRTRLLAALTANLFYFRSQSSTDSHKASCSELKSPQAIKLWPTEEVPLASLQIEALNLSLDLSANNKNCAGELSACVEIYGLEYNIC